jgi:hypothetical protein
MTVFGQRVPFDGVLALGQNPRQGNKHLLVVLRCKSRVPCGSDASVGAMQSDAREAELYAFRKV